MTGYYNQKLTQTMNVQEKFYLTALFHCNRKGCGFGGLLLSTATGGCGFELFNVERTEVSSLVLYKHHYLQNLCL